MESIALRHAANPQLRPRHTPSIHPGHDIRVVCDCAGGCPASPDQLSAPSGSFAAKKDGATVTFSWNKPEAAADASEVVGYYMAAMEPAAGTPPQGVSSAEGH